MYIHIILCMRNMWGLVAKAGRAGALSQKEALAYAKGEFKATAQNFTSRDFLCVCISLSLSLSIYIYVYVYIYIYICFTIYIYIYYEY